MIFVVGGIILCLVILVFVILVVESRVLSYRLSQLSLQEKTIYYEKKLNLFQLEKEKLHLFQLEKEKLHLFQLEKDCSFKNNQIDIKTATQLLRESFKTKKSVSVPCRGLNITNQLLLPNKIILYIHGAWSGLFQKHHRINGYLSVDAVRGAISRFAFLKLDVPVVAFQLPTEPTGTLNFGQEDDQMVLSIVVEKLIKMNPQVQIIMYGVCVGALRIQRWISAFPNSQNIHSIILESPLPCIKRLVSFSEKDNMNEWMYYLFSLLLPSYKRHPLIQACRCDTPTLLFGCQEDRLCTKNDLLSLQKQNFPNSKIVFVEKKWNHGELFKDAGFQNEFQDLIRLTPSYQFD
jgi:hypothetical protein